MKLQDCALKIVERVARVEVERAEAKWPHCAGIFHQPVMPKRK